MLAPNLNTEFGSARRRHGFPHIQGCCHEVGAWKLTAPSGTYKTITQFETTSVFQANSPNWLTLPEGMLSVTVRAGTTKNLGPVALTAH